MDRVYAVRLIGAAETVVHHENETGPRERAGFLCAVGGDDGLRDSGCGDGYPLGWFVYGDGGSPGWDDEVHNGLHETGLNRLCTPNSDFLNTHAFPL